MHETGKSTNKSNYSIFCDIAGKAATEALRLSIPIALDACMSFAVSKLERLVMLGKRKALTKS